MAKRIVSLFIFFCCTLFLLAATAHADSVYLDSGEILSGTIVHNTLDTIVLETQYGREEIQKKYVKRIVVFKNLDRKDAPATLHPSALPGVSQPQENPPGQQAAPRLQTTPEDAKKADEFFTTQITDEKAAENEDMQPLAEETAAGEEPQTDESILRVSYDLPGKHEMAGTVNGMTFSDSRDTEQGTAVSGSYVRYIADNVGIGAGFAIQLPRKAKAFAGKFNFLPLYGIAKFRSAPRNGRYKYLLAELGYSFFYGDNDYKGSSILEGGAHVAGGAGISFGKVCLELLYTVDRGNMKESGYFYDPYYGNYYVDMQSEIKYSRYMLSLSGRF